MVSLARQCRSGVRENRRLPVFLDTETPTIKELKLLKAVKEFQIYIENNAAMITNYGERYRNGEAIATGFVESAVNQIIAKRFVKNNRCGGQSAGRTCCCKSESKFLMMSYRRISASGIRNLPSKNPMILRQVKKWH